LAWPVGIGAALGLIAYIFANTHRNRLQAALEDVGRSLDITTTRAAAAKTSRRSAGRAAE
jgi:hypothetical protein